MKRHDYDVLVIGSGPGGEGAAMKSAKEGKRVAVVERYPQLGGACTHWATIPSKTLRHTVGTLMDLRTSPLFRECATQLDVTFADLVRTANTVIAKQVTVRTSFYDRNHVRVFHGRAKLKDEHTVEVTREDSVVETITADSMILAVGGRPYRPPNVDFSHPRIFDSDTILKLDHTPSSITIYGAGVVGCEYASIFRNLGAKVNLINTRDKLLSFLDDEIIDALAYHLRDGGVLIRNNEEMKRVTPTDDGVVLSLKSGKKLRSDVLLWANGRTGNTDGLGLDSVGIEPNGRGQIEIDESYRTTVPHIYAVGDVVGFPSLASAAYDQGRFAANHLMFGVCDANLVENVPTGIYTMPEISSVGPTERELTDAQVPYEVGHALFRSLARAQITGSTVGMLKLLFHRETMQVLAIHCFGYQASEILHIGQAIMSQKGDANSIMYFINTTFNYPTMAEAYRVAALNGYNRVRELEGLDTESVVPPAP
ncbi:MAG: Si-specific NAD(P)(+) transhydrogenase [Deltaproteobacteria bacterium]|nr:Si-specific NAD(P)(+) transhydrogenase [Deltaproteobacteria bacterium]